jgi:hypothetical protein
MYGYVDAEKSAMEVVEFKPADFNLHINAAACKNN